MGSVWKRLGSDVKVLEALPEFLHWLTNLFLRKPLKFSQKSWLQISLNCQNIKIKSKEKGSSHLQY